MKKSAIALLMISPVLHAGESLIVVQDMGGASALPYYEALNLQARNVDALPPFFIVGDDAVSADWLRRNATSLRERGAVGLVVNVETVETLNRLRALAPDIPLSPAPADDLADRLGLRHYPALMTATGIEP